MPKSFRLPPKSALIVAALVAGPAVLAPLLPAEARAANFMAFGALGLFLGARAGVAWAAGLVLGAKLLSDLIAYAHTGFDADYLPMVSVYAALVLYAVAGWAIAGRRATVCRAGGAALLGSAFFFLMTNFFAWWAMALPYQQNLAGLWDAYRMGLPFHRATLLSDLAYTAVLFGLEAALVWATAAKPVVAEEVR